MAVGINRYTVAGLIGYSSTVFPPPSAPLTLFVNLKRLLTNLSLLLRPRTTDRRCVGAIALSEFVGRIEPEGIER